MKIKNVNIIFINCIFDCKVNFICNGKVTFKNCIFQGESNGVRFDTTKIDKNLNIIFKEMNHIQNLQILSMNNRYHPFITIEEPCFIYQLCSNTDIIILNKKPIILAKGCINGKVHCSNNNIVTEKDFICQDVFYMP